ncbi:MAG: YjbQ family protein [Cyclobacteriaceae bacterium]
MISIQREIFMPPISRGFHIVTSKILSEIPELKEVKVGTLHVFIKHTSASLSINENADPTVRTDMESGFNEIAPENAPYYRHTLEGPDDMPAHIKASLLGSSVTIPVSNGRLNLGTWQGIYLCEHRDYGGSRRIILTLMGS